jgi:uncharacterized pyridoxal phosphate-containing UPF0001 family protein
LNAVSNQGSSPLATRLERTRARIAAAAARAGRPPAELLAVVKLVPDEVVAELFDLGVREVAENRVQKLAARPPALLARGRFHLIGSLQTNKARKAVETAAEFHAAPESRVPALSAIQGALDQARKTVTTIEKKRAVLDALMKAAEWSGS